MKKNLFGFIAIFAMTTASFANTEISKNDLKKVENKETKKEPKKSNEENDVLCTITCSRTSGGVTVTTTGGNWFSSCERAASRCEAKLDSITQE